MSQIIIDINHITKDFGNGKGVFDASFKIPKGVTMSFLGPNGAGKTTTIRQLMGFTKPDSGSVKINGIDCFGNSETLMKQVGYLPGEITMMNEMKGIEFLYFMSKMKKMNDLSYMNELIQWFELDPNAKIRRMSKGMKQKIGIVCAFMNHPDILILDEPTSGLDPLMQNRFVELILKEKQRGTTILMSSHMFEEVEKTCDQCVIIKEGKIIAIEDMQKLRNNRTRIYCITFKNAQDASSFGSNFKNGVAIKDCYVEINIPTSELDRFLQILSQFTILDLDIKTIGLEELFLQFYGEYQHE